MERLNEKEYINVLLKGLEEKKADNIVTYDVRTLTTFTDYIIIATVYSEVQLKSVVNYLKKNIKPKPYHVEGAESGGWLLMDYDSAIVNIFLPETREFYALERIWGDAKKL